MSKTKNKKVVLLFGTFDILHNGHKSVFKQAQHFGDYIIVILARDNTIKKVKKRESVFKEKIRLANLKKTGWADLVLLGDKKDPYKLIKKIKPQIICLGYDQKFFIKNLRKSLKDGGLNTKIVHLKSYKPRTYKSSILRKKIYA